MLINCPNCSAKYNVNPKSLGENGKKVKCLKCSHTWFEKTPDNSAEKKAEQEQKLSDSKTENINSDSNASDKPQEGESTKDKKTDSSESTASNVSVNSKNESKNIPTQNLPATNSFRVPTILKILPVIIVFIAMVLFVLFYKSLFENVPVLKQLYSHLGNYNTKEVVLYDFFISKQKRDNKENLVITGQIVNNSYINVKVPELRYIVYNKENKKIFSHVFPSNGKFMKSGERIQIKNTISKVHKSASLFKVDIGNSYDLFLR